MPGFNQTGPIGQGPMTGGKMGRCTNYGASLRNKKTTSSGDQIEDQVDYTLDRRLGIGRRRGVKGRGMGIKNRFRGMV